MCICQSGTETRGVNEVEQPSKGRAHVACKSDGRLSVDGRLQAADVEFGDDQEVEQDVDGEFDRADDEWYIRLVQCTGCARYRCFERRGKSSKGAQADVGQTCISHPGGYETLGKRPSNGDEDDAEDEPEKGLEQDQSMGKTQASVKGTCRLVANDQPCGSGEAFVDDFGYNADVGIAIGRCDERAVDVGYPEFGESPVERGQEEGEDIEEESTEIPVGNSQRRKADSHEAILPVTTGPDVDDAWLVFILSGILNSLGHGVVLFGKHGVAKARGNNGSPHDERGAYLDLSTWIGSAGRAW